MVRRHRSTRCQTSLPGYRNSPRLCLWLSLLRQHPLPDCCHLITTRLTAPIAIHRKIRKRFPAPSDDLPAPSGSFPAWRASDSPPAHRVPPTPDDIPPKAKRYPQKRESVLPIAKRFPALPERVPPSSEDYPVKPASVPPTSSRFPPTRESYGTTFLSYKTSWESLKTGRKR